MVLVATAAPQQGFSWRRPATEAEWRSLRGGASTQLTTNAG
jgi:hypothetical protein